MIRTFRYGMVPRRKALVDEKRRAMLSVLGVSSIRDLATATRDQILELRGFRAPGAAAVVDGIYEDVCDHVAYARAVLDKCDVTSENHYLTHYDNEAFQPKNVAPKFDGEPPPV